MNRHSVGSGGASLRCPHMPLCVRNLTCTRRLYHAEDIRSSRSSPATACTPTLKLWCGPPNVSALQLTSGTEPLDTALARPAKPILAGGAIATHCTSARAGASQVGLRMPRRMRQRQEHLSRPLSPTGNVVLHDGEAAREAVFVPQLVKDALGRALLLLLRPTFVLGQETIDDGDESAPSFGFTGGFVRR